MSGEHYTARAALLKSVASADLDLSVPAIVPSFCGGSKDTRGCWQQRRIEELIDAISQLGAMRWHGFGIIDASVIISRRFNGRRLGCGKQLRASPRTIQRYWYRWRLTRDPRVLELKYRHVSPY